MQRKKLDVLNGGRFHHLGLAVKSMDNDVESIYDPLQKVTVSFVDFNGVTVELIKPESDDSPARNYVGKGIYHLCYEVDDINKSIEDAEENGFKCIAPPKPAIAFDGREIAWLISPQLGLIELLQK